MLKKVYILFFILILALSASTAFSQNFPVSVNTTITPPYSTYLADYVAPGSQKLALNIFLNDINRPELQTRLRLRIEGQGILIETKPEFLPAPLILQGGIPERLISSDLAPYFLPQNLNFSGITRQQFQRSGQLPEGLYSICFEVLEYNRGVKVSNSGCTMAWLILNDPPLINLPMQAEKLKPQDPQYVTFQWTPRHTGSPNSAFSTEYEFTLVELWPESRNPNDAILTSPPIYQTTTQSTTLIYGPAETPLVPGRRYAFRVKAKSISGIDELDLFKNQGYSQVHSFQYGDACDIPLNIKAKATNSGTFKVIYEPNTNHTAFSIRYRKANDPKATWYEVDSYFEEIEINGLQPETTYEYQLTAGCGPFGSEYSPVALVTTDAMPEVTYACGLPLEEFDFGNTEPLPSLQRNDILYAGDFNVKISEATGSAGTFTGKGTVVVPYLDNLAVSVEFANITVNTEYRMTAGSMDVKGIGVDVLPDNFTDFLEELDETLASVDDVLGDVNAGLDIADEILGEVGDLANDILDNGPFTTEEEIALDGASVEKYNEEAKKAINDAASALGGSATVESIADAARKVAQGMALKNRANKLQNIYNNSDTLKVIAVEFYENLSGQGKYGFDTKQYEPHRLHYNIIVLPSNQTVPVPWAATKAGEAASIKAKWLPESNVPADSIVFKSGADGATLEASRSGYEWTITLPTIAKAQSLVINAINSANNETVGKLNAIGYETIERKVHLIPVGTESSISATEVQAELNRIYAQAIASWTVEKHAAIQVEAYDGTLQDDEQVMLSTYSDGMKAIIKAYQATAGVTINDNDFYLFLVGNSQTDKAGYMPRKHRFGFIYQNESSDIKRTIAHELGHGAFRLQHIWEEYPTISETTTNLMDYGTGTNLRKYQWDLIHNPPVVVGLVEDLEEGSYTDKTYMQKVLQRIRCAYVDGSTDITFAKSEEITATLPEFGKLTIKFFPDKSITLNSVETQSIEETIGGTRNTTTIRFKMLDYGKIQVFIRSDIYQDAAEKLTKLQDYLFPTDKGVIADEVEALSDIFTKEKFSSADIERIRAVANCGAQFFSPQQKYQIIKHLVEDQHFLFEVDEDIILDLIENYNGNFSQYAQNLLNLFANDTWLLERLFEDIGNDLWKNEANFERFLGQIFTLWKSTDWSDDTKHNYRYVESWYTATGSSSPGISPYNVAYDKDILFYEYDYKVSLSNNKLTVNRESSVDGNTRFEYHPFQPVYLTGKTNDKHELSLTEPIPAIFYAGLVKKNNLQNNITRLSIATDLVLTVSGIGNLTRVRHLNKLKQFTRIIVGGLDLSTSAVDLILDYTTLCQNPEFCSQLKKYNFYLQLALLTEAGSSSLFQNEFKKVFDETKDAYNANRSSLNYSEGSSELTKLDEHFEIPILVGKYDWNLVRRYFHHIQEITNRSVHPKQIEKLQEALRAKEYKKLSSTDYADHKKLYNQSKKAQIISEWEINTGQNWPKYEEDVLRPDGSIRKIAGQPYDLHHIIEQNYEGPHEWWNAHPARFPDEHQGGIHGAGSPARELFK